MIKLTQLISEHEEGSQKPYMYSPVGFSCAVCSYLNYNKDEDAWTCGSTEYQEHMGTQFLVKEDGETRLKKEDLKHYCSNWFEPRTK